MKEAAGQLKSRLVTPYIEFAVRIILALVICGETALAFMRFTDGSGMFCIDPPAADPGWEWKVPLAWAIIYGISTFVGVAVAAFRVKSLKISIIIATITIGAFITLRSISFNPWKSYFDSIFLYFKETEAHIGIPVMVAAGTLACIVARLTRKTENGDLTG